MRKKLKTPDHKAKIMLFIRTFYLFLGALMIFSTTAEAGSKPWPNYWWWPTHWEDQPITKAYLRGGTIPQNTQWSQDGWHPLDWINDRGSAEAVIEGFYHADIIRDQDEDDDIPVLEIGPNFMELSPRDKRRVAHFIDFVYGITDQTDAGVFRIVHYHSCDPVGLYTKHGLQLQ